MSEMMTLTKPKPDRGESRIMNQLTLTSTGQRPLKLLIEAALDNELRLLQAAIQGA